MRILILTQWFDPEPAFKGLSFAKELVARGHEVQVITGFPNYPGGVLYPGYRVRLIQRETMDGIAVVRLPLYPSHDGSALGRVFNYASFAVAAAILSPFVAKPADVAYVYHPPATIGLPAIALRMFRRIPFVYDVMDLWPDTLAATGMVRSRSAIALAGVWTRMVYRSASRISVVSEGFRAALTQRGVPDEKITVIYNWSPEEVSAVVADATASQSAALSDGFDVIFAGNMGKAQALHTILEAAQLLSETAPAVRFVLIGDGVEANSLREQARKMDLSNVLFLPRMSRSEVATILPLADVLLVHLRGEPLFEITIPSKTQAYLQAGRPILVAVEGEAADLILEAGAGLCCEPGNAHAIADAVRELQKMSVSARDEMGRRGREFYEERMSMSVGVGRLEGLLEAATSRDSNCFSHNVPE